MVVAPPSSSSIASSHVSWSQPPSRAHALSAMHLTFHHAAAVSCGTIPATHPIYLYYHNYAYRHACEIGRRGWVVYIGSATAARGRSRGRIRGTALFAPSIHIAQGFSVQFLAPVSGIGSQLDVRFPSSPVDHYPPVNWHFCSPPVRCAAKLVGLEVRHVGVVTVQLLVTLSSP